MCVYKQGPRREIFILYSENSEVTACEEINKIYI